MKKLKLLILSLLFVAGIALAEQKLIFKGREVTEHGIRVSQTIVENMGVTEDGVVYFICLTDSSKWEFTVDSVGVISTEKIIE